MEGHINNTLNSDILSMIMYKFENDEIHDFYQFVSTCKTTFTFFQKNRKLTEEYFVIVKANVDDKIYIYNYDNMKKYRKQKDWNNFKMPVVTYIRPHKLWKCDNLKYHRIEWSHNGKLHKDGDKPAVITGNGDREWWWEGGLHRDNDKPAIIRADGTKEWYYHGKLHRLWSDLPTIEHSNGDREWHSFGCRVKNQSAAI